MSVLEFIDHCDDSLKINIRHITEHWSVNEKVGNLFCDDAEYICSCVVRDWSVSGNGKIWLEVTDV